MGSLWRWTPCLTYLRVPLLRSPPSSIFQSPRYTSLPPVTGSPERDAHIRRLSGHIFQGPRGRSSPQDPLHRTSSKREALFPESPLTFSQRPLQISPPTGSPNGGPYGKRCPSLEPFHHILQGPQQASPPPRFPSQSSHRERHHTSRDPLAIS